MGAGVFLLAFLILSNVQVKRRPLPSLEEGSNLLKEQALKKRKNLFNADAISSRLGFIARPFLRIAYLRRLKDEADVLRINLNLPMLIISKLLLAVVLGIFSFILLSPTYAIVGLVIGFFAPDFVFTNKIRGKKEAIARIFPETIDLLDMCISAGADFLSAINWVIQKSTPNPFMEQLGVVLSEVKVGKPRVEALKDMARKLKIPEVSSFVRTVILAERMGTSIEDAFRNLSEDTRGMRFQAGERYAIKASLKILFPLLFCILPTIMIVVAGPILIKFMQGDMIPKGAGF